MPILRPTKNINDRSNQGTFISDSTENILENCEECPVAQYIIKEQGINKFVNSKGEKTKLGLHIETCEICNGAARQLRYPGNSEMYEIKNFDTKRLLGWARSKGINSDDVTRIISVAIEDLLAIQDKDQELKRLCEVIENLKEKYETLKTIKTTSQGKILFPHQKQVTKETMQLKNLKYKDYLLKKYEIEISLLKEELKNVTQRPK